MVVYEPVQAAVWQCLDHYNYVDAVFLSETVVELSKDELHSLRHCLDFCNQVFSQFETIGNEESLFILASCYYRMGKPLRAYLLLHSKGSSTPHCRFLLAQCCLDINKLSEAESAITGGILVPKCKTLDDIVSDFGDNASFALRILGEIYSKTERQVKAIECFQHSLKLNPFLWSSFESLCQLGEMPDPVQTFKVNPQNLNMVCHSTQSSPAVSGNPPCIGEMITPIVESQEETPNPAKDLYIEIMTPETVNTVTPECDYNYLPMPTAPRPQRSTSRPWNIRGRQIDLSPLTPSFGVMPLEMTPTPGSQNSLHILPSPVMTTIKTSSARTSQQPVLSQPQFGNPKPPVFSQSGNTNSSKEGQTTTTHGFVQSTSPNNIQSNVGGLRRSTRLFNNHPSSSVKENNKNQGENKLLSPRAPSKRSKAKLSWTPQQMNEKNKSEMTINDSTKASTATVVQAHMVQMQRQSANGLMQLLQELAKAHQALTQFNCSRALELFNSIPPQHYNTGWVLCQIGRAYFELSDYQKAEKVFSEVRRLEPHHLEGMEIYSTVLWHLQMETQLSGLAQELTELDKSSPEAWCATGNCFSLQKEHDVAIRFFQRAMQVDPNFAYAYTLLGHEYVLIEELDKAMAAFRNAIRIDPRHYNAWYGIGMVYYKQEKFSLAGLHFQKALAINPRSSALLCHVGVVQHALKKSKSALKTLNLAISIDPKNPLCKFHKASVLFANDRHKEALQELEELKEIVPKESLVYFLMGKVHKKMGNTHLALINFSWAMDLDPKGTNNHIKETINKRYLTEEDDTMQNEAIAVADPLEGTSNGSQLMEGDDFGLRAESDESL